jgi:DNA adenine methylase
MKPLIKWAGGKTWFLPKFAELTAGVKYTALVELFAGGAAVAFGREERSVVLNDINGPLIDFYKNTKLGHLPPVYNNMNEEVYAKLRARYNAVKSQPQGGFPRESGDLFYIMNRFAFNGLYRENAGGQFNVPWNKKQRAVDSDFHSAYMLMSQGDWVLSNLPYEQVPLCPGDLVFADPPYADVFSTYAAGGFGWAAQEALAAYLSKLNLPVVATNNGAPKVLELYRDYGFNVQTINAPRKISCTGDREPACEMIATRNLVST